VTTATAVTPTSSRTHTNGVRELPKTNQATAVTAEPVVPGAIGARPENSTVAITVRRKAIRPIRYEKSSENRTSG